MGKLSEKINEKIENKRLEIFQKVLPVDNYITLSSLLCDLLYEKDIELSKKIIDLLLDLLYHVKNYIDYHNTKRDFIYEYFDILMNNACEIEFKEKQNKEIANIQKEIGVLVYI